MDGVVTAIELQGIVRNRTKIGVEDGQAEDLINLRFVNGSWRTSGDGREMNWHLYSRGQQIDFSDYKEFYIHTNVYRHLLAVKKRTNELCWIGNINTDNTTVEQIPGAVEKVLTTVTGEVTITQTGHLLTVIDEADNFEYFIFKTSDDEYIHIEVDENGKQTDRGIYPFGQVHFNLYSPNDEEHLLTPDYHPGFTELSEGHLPYSICKSELKKYNLFGQPFMALAAIRLYDDTFVYTSQPVLLFPRDNIINLNRQGKSVTCYPLKIGDGLFRQYIYNNIGDTVAGEAGVIAFTTNGNADNQTYTGDVTPIDYFIHETGFNGESSYDDKVIALRNEDLIYGFINLFDRGEAVMDNMFIRVGGSELVVSIGKELVDLITLNNDVFKSFCIFVTPEIDIYKTNVDGELLNPQKKRIGWSWNERPDDQSEYSNTHGTYFFNYIFELRNDEDIIYDLFKQPFFLLREYKMNEISGLYANPIVNLSSLEYEGLLENDNLVNRPILKVESTARLTYIPKYSYQYNNKLHITNYKTRQFHGYPIDSFMLNNHSVKPIVGHYFKGILPNIDGNNDYYLQFCGMVGDNAYIHQDSDVFRSDFLAAAKSYNHALAQIIVQIKTTYGTQQVVRYIEPTEAGLSNGLKNYFESLNPLLTFPDNRATKMIIRFLWLDDSRRVNYASKEFNLISHQLYNFAYYISEDLLPISTHDFGGGSLILEGADSYLESYERDSEPTSPIPIADIVTEQNVEEYYPNGLKVSATDNPIVFPVENAYRIGSGEILAICSNAIAVGTGQTGSAPLYIFCSDGIYALFVDSSGQMTYTNARVIARDVLNNPRSVTPIDAGVVFTTDRGLMMISGEQVEEIGEPAEGEVLGYAVYAAPTDNYRDTIKMARGALQRVAEFPVAFVDTTDFLTYLKGAIVNYNHNERELMISNPNKNYSYILDRNGNWTRRDYTADEYVNNYPTSYRLHDGVFYKVDEEGDDNTPLEEKKEADNKFFYLSNIIKLGSIGFKQGARFVVRGYFNAISGKHIGCYVFGSYDGRKWALLGGNEKSGTFTDIGCKIERTDVRFYRICLAGQLQGDSRIDYMEISSNPSVLNTKIR